MYLHIWLPIGYKNKAQKAFWSQSIYYKPESIRVWKMTGDKIVSCSRGPKVLGVRTYKTARLGVYSWGQGDTPFKSYASVEAAQHCPPPSDVCRMCFPLLNWDSWSAVVQCCRGYSDAGAQERVGKIRPLEVKQRRRKRRLWNKTPSLQTSAQASRARRELHGPASAFKHLQKRSFLKSNKQHPVIANF